MRSIFLSGLVLTLFLGAPVAAQPMHGQELHNYLEEYLKVQGGYEGNSIKAGMFLGYVRGVLDALEGTALCPPNNISAEYLIQQVTQYLRNHPPSQRSVARTLVFEALRGQFACQR
ncbi:putative Rap1a domain-containing protein [Gammaproteobacteria bacterium]